MCPPFMFFILFLSNLLCGCMGLKGLSPSTLQIMSPFTAFKTKDSDSSALSHVTSLLTHRTPIKLHLTGKSRFILII